MNRSVLITVLSTILVIVTLACMLAIVLGVILGLNRKDESIVTTISNRTCQPNWVFYNQHCYRFYSLIKTWSEAKADCISQRAFLVKIDNSEEFAFLNDYIADKIRGYQIWVGASSTEILIFRWSLDNARLSEVSPFWCRGEPNNGGYRRLTSQNYEPCVEIGSRDNRYCLNDIICNQRLFYLCEAVI